MFKNYLKVALRNISRTKLFSLINITGLAIGIAGTLVILMYVANELSYENFHKNRKQIYRVSVEFGERGSTMKFPGAMPALAPALLEEAHDVVNAVRFERDEHAILEYNEKKFNEQNFFFADSSVFDVFSFTMIRGSIKDALIDPFSSKSVFRKILVIAQFTMAIILIIGTMIIFKQLDFMKNSDLGFKKQNVVLINFQPRNPNFKGKYPVLMNQFKQYPQIVSVSGAYTVPGRISKETKTIQKKTEVGIEQFSIQAIAVDYDYVDSMGMEVVQGRNFSRKMLTDERNAILLNQEAVKMFNLAQPIGEKFMVPGREGLKEMTVIGVVKDFHVYSLKQKIEALMLYINPDYFFSIAVRIRPEDTQKTLAFLGETWKGIFPDSPFNYIFLEDAYHQLYISEEKISQLLTLFSGLAVFVACLGLFGLASYVAEQRHKEIGIRKVLGANISSIVLLLSKDFTKSVLIANAVAWPVAYYAMNKWLQNYAYRIGLALWMFVAAGLLILAISLFTVSYQALKAALANPVDSIRYE